MHIMKGDKKKSWEGAIYPVQKILRGCAVKRLAKSAFWYNVK